MSFTTPLDTYLKGTHGRQFYQDKLILTAFRACIAARSSHPLCFSWLAMRLQLLTRYPVSDSWDGCWLSPRLPPLESFSSLPGYQLALPSYVVYAPCPGLCLLARSSPEWD